MQSTCQSLLRIVSLKDNIFFSCCCRCVLVCETVGYKRLDKIEAEECVVTRNTSHTKREFVSILALGVDDYNF